MIGSFYDPFKIIIYEQFLDTLDDRNFANGISEIIKMGVIRDKQLFEKLE